MGLNEEHNGSPTGGSHDFINYNATCGAWYRQSTKQLQHRKLTLEQWAQSHQSQQYWRERVISCVPQRASLTPPVPTAMPTEHQQPIRPLQLFSPPSSMKTMHNAIFCRFSLTKNHPRTQSPAIWPQIRERFIKQARRIYQHFRDAFDRPNGMDTEVDSCSKMESRYETHKTWPLLPITDRLFITRISRQTNSSSALQRRNLRKINRKG